MESIKFFGAAIAIAVILFVTLSGVAYQDSSGYEQAVKNAGFTNVVLIEKVGWFSGFRGCDEKDQVGWRFAATNPQGNRITVLVCGGLFKSPTIRF